MNVEAVLRSGIGRDLNTARPVCSLAVTLRISERGQTAAGGGGEGDRDNGGGTGHRAGDSGSSGPDRIWPVKSGLFAIAP